MQALRHQKCHVELQSLPNWKTLELYHRCHATKLSGSYHQTSNSILEGLQLVHQPATHPNKELVAVV